MYKIFYKLLLLGTLLQPSINSFAMDINPNLDKCDVTWTIFENKIAQPVNQDKLVNGWMKMADQCGAMDSFYMRLGMIYRSYNGIVDADKILQKISLGSKEHRHLDLQIQLVREFTEKGKADYRYYIDQYQKLIDDFPKWYIGYQALSEIAKYSHDYKLMKNAASKSLELVPSAAAYKQLAIAEYALNQFDLTIVDANKAVAIASKYSADTELMIKLAAAYFVMSRRDEANGTLDRLSMANPGVINDPLFIRTRNVFSGK